MKAYQNYYILNAYDYFCGSKRKAVEAAEGAQQMQIVVFTVFFALSIQMYKSKSFSMYQYEITELMASALPEDENSRLSSD